MSGLAKRGDPYCQGSAHGPRGNPTPWPAIAYARTVQLMTPEDEGELMLRDARGDIHAFETLYGRHLGALYRYLVRHTRNTETANDLFQEVWSKVIASRERYEPRAQFRTFLYRIAHN